MEKGFTFIETAVADLTIQEAMSEAIQEAKIAFNEDEMPVGAVILQNGELLASAHNQREALCDPTAHAEILAIRKAAKKLGKRRLHDAVIVVTLEPCPMCAGAILAAEMNRVIYGARDSVKGCAGSLYALTEDRELGEIPSTGGMREEECQRIISDFFLRTRREKKNSV